MEEYLSETVSISVDDHEIAKPAEHAAPEEIGSGVVKSVLGKGGAAVVYEIWNQKLEISRAVKLWRPFSSEKVLNRFETEIKITAKLHHPNIVEIHNVGEWEGLPFIEMEKVDGLSLKELLKKRGAFPAEVSLAVAISICRALTYAHNHIYNLSERRFRGVTHCDIKPANIMVGFDGVVKLMDFGIAHPAGVSKSSDQNKITGSLQYMSPEQLGAKKIDPRTDIFSMGVVFYEMVSGSKAFPAQSVDALIVKRNANDFVPLESFCKDVSPKIRSIISKCMEPDADSRYDTSNVLLQDLERAYRKVTSIPPEQIISRFMNGKNLRKKNSFFSTPMATLIVLGLLTLSVTSYVLKDTFREWTNRSVETVQKPVVDSTAHAKDLTAEKKQPSGKSQKTKVSSSRKRAAVGKKVSNKSLPKQAEKSNVVKKEIQSVAKKEPQSIVPNLVAEPIAQEESVDSVDSAKMTTATDSTLAKSSAFSEPEYVQDEAWDLEPSVPVKREEGVSDQLILDQIQQFISSNEFDKARRLCVEFPIEDAEYYLIYAQLLSKNGEFTKAIQYAEKAMNYSSKRKSPDEVRGDMLYVKAQCLGALFELNENDETGRKAMEVWYDLKYLYRNNTSHPRYRHADKEIRSISTVLP